MCLMLVQPDIPRFACMVGMYALLCKKAVFTIAHINIVRKNPNQVTIDLSFIFNFP